MINGSVAMIQIKVTDINAYKFGNRREAAPAPKIIDEVKIMQNPTVHIITISKAPNLTKCK